MNMIRNLLLSTMLLSLSHKHEMELIRTEAKGTLEQIQGELKVFNINTTLMESERDIFLQDDRGFTVTGIFWGGITPTEGAYMVNNEPYQYSQQLYGPVPNWIKSRFGYGPGKENQERMETLMGTLVQHNLMTSEGRSLLRGIDADYMRVFEPPPPSSCCQPVKPFSDLRESLIRFILDYTQQQLNRLA